MARARKISLEGDRDGETFVRERDRVRLNNQAYRVWKSMRPGGWMTLRDIAKFTGDPEASISARIRDLRKPEFGGHTIETRYVSRGLHKYRLVPNPDVQVIGGDA